MSTQKTGVLILHGFAGDIKEVLPLARFLQEKGYVVECPTLEGHGMTRRQLKLSNRRQWLTSAEEGYKRLRMRSDHIIVIGFSMGGLLGLNLAAKYPVEMLFTLCTPYHYWDVRQAYSYLREDFRTVAARYLNSMFRIPLRSMLEFRKLLTETKRLLPEITCPYTIVQGRRDDTVQSVSAEHLRRQVGSDDVQVEYFERSGHLILLGEEADDVIHYVHQTLERKLPHLAGRYR
ncbi:alpha/beta hydrolase [Brevibacillus dissolubilis]|uniref:alpha/beta hydrolase n=1 Tax=Brevibacillus dissolubilis TaxID=1844116 RepID=UPI0011173C6F|nr:alpha/beta fold hydrolase [Brevibacillus dissolubilis]